MRKKVITSAILTIAFALSMLIGGTYALFTSESRTSIEVTSGKVSIEAKVNEESIQTKQLNSDYVVGEENTFGGSISFVENQVLLERLVPGDGVKFTVDIKNESNVAVLYRVKISSPSDEASLLLFSGLNFKVNGSDFTGVILYKSEWNELAVGNNPANISFEIELPENAGNEYQDLATSIILTVEAVQGNAGYTGEEEFVYFDGSAVLNNDGVKLDIPEGIFAPGVIPTLEISKPSAPTNFVVKQDATSPVLVQTLDIKLPGIAEGNEELITVTIPVDKHMPNAVVYYNNGQELVPMQTTPVSDQPDANGLYYIQFTTTHFSEYVLVERSYDALIINNDGKRTFAYGNLNNIMSAARNGSTIKLYKDAQVTKTILVDNDITLDLNGYDIIAQEATSIYNNQIFQVRTNVPTEFVITNSQAQGGNIILNNRKLLLSYKPVSIEKVTIKQFDENSTDAVKTGTQSEFVLSYDLLTLEGVKVLITRTSKNPTSQIFNAHGSLVIKNSEITIDEHHTNVFQVGGAKFEVDGLNLVIPMNGAEQIISRNMGVQIIINNMDIVTTSTRSTGLNLLNNSKGSEGVTIQINSGKFSGVARMHWSSSDPSVLQVNGGTYDFNPEAFVDSTNYVVVASAETTFTVVEPTTGFVVDESNRVIWVYDGAGLLEATALINGGLYSGYTIKMMDDIDLDEPIIIGG